MLFDCHVDVYVLTCCSLKIHLHRWIIIKACYYIRNMKLKRPSGANDYDTLADIDGEGVSSSTVDDS